MEGLEISEINFSYITNRNAIFRFDSNYFQKEFLFDEGKIRNKKYKKLKESDVSIKSFGAYSLNNDVEYKEFGIPFIRGVNLKSGRIDFSDTIFIDSKAHSLLWKSEVKPETILLSMSGTIGDVAIAPPTASYPMNSNQDIAKINIHSGFNPYFVYLFLLSKFGQNYLKREARGSVQQHVFLSQIEEFEIPILIDDFCFLLERAVKFSDKLNSLFNSFAIQAENLLLSEVGFNGFVPSTDNINTKKYSDSFLCSGRLDSEYYLPKYEQVLEHILKGKHEALSNLVTIKKSIEPGSAAYSDEGLPFIRVSDYDKSGLTSPNKYLSNSYYKENADVLNKLKPKKETILFSKDGSVGIAHMLTQDLNGITSGAILHLHVKDQKQVLPEYLTLVLNSQLVQMQAERDAGGSIILHWRVGEIQKVVVPIISMNKQNEIKKFINQSMEAKEKSSLLLDIAKRAVEIAIEQNESIAQQYIQDECLQLGIVLNDMKS